jgi:hypothetical protein
MLRGRAAGLGFLGGMGVWASLMGKVRPMWPSWVVTYPISIALYSSGGTWCGWCNWQRGTVVLFPWGHSFFILTLSWPLLIHPVSTPCAHRPSLDRILIFRFHIRGFTQSQIENIQKKIHLY